MNKKEKIKTDIDKIRDLEFDWDSYGSFSFDNIVCDNVLWFIDNIPDYSLNYNVNISPCAGGKSIQVEFQNGDKDLEVEIFKNKILYLKAIDKDLNYEEGQFYLDKNDKNKILNLIEWLC